MPKTRKRNGAALTVPRAMSEPEIARAAKQLADTQLELEQFRDHARDERKRLRERQQDLEADISALAEQVRTGSRKISAQRGLPGVAAEQ